MLRRSTIGKTSSSLKQRQLSHLHSQLAQLEANLSDFETLLKVTTFQAEYMKKLGIMHGALFMASHKIFEEEVRAQEMDEDENVDEGDREGQGQEQGQGDADGGEH